MSNDERNRSSEVEKILRKMGDEIRELEQVNALRNAVSDEEAEQIISNLGFYLESQALGEFYGVEETKFRETLNKLMENQRSRKLYFIDILGAHAWANPLFQVYFYEHVSRYFKRNYSNSWNLKFTDKLIKNKIEERLAAGYIDVDDVFSDYDIGDPIDLHMIRILSWKDEDMKSDIAQNLIDLHRVFNIPLLYFPPEKLFGLFFTERKLEFHVMVDEKDKILPDGCWIYYEEITDDEHIERKRVERKRVPYRLYKKKFRDIRPHKIFKDILQQKMCVFAIEKKKELLKELEPRKKLLFINSPTRDLGGFRGAPTSLLYALGPLIEEIKSKKIKISGFSGQNIFDPTHYKDTMAADLRKRLRLINPDIVGISTTSDAFHISREIAKHIKEYNKDIIVIVGGPHIDEVDFDPTKGNPNNPFDKRYEDNGFDFAIAGDGEYMLLELIRQIMKGWETLPRRDINELKEYIFRNEDCFGDPKVKGFAKLYFKYSGGQAGISSSWKGLDLNLLPPPRYEYLKKDHFMDFDIFKDHEGNTEKCVQIIFHRGCRNDCTFCSERYVISERKGYYNASKKVDRVIDEMWHYVKEFGVRAFFFDDSTFIENEEFVEKLCEKLISTGLHKITRWGCLNRFDKVKDAKLIKKMVDAGLTYMYLGLEVFSDAVLLAMKKDSPEERKVSVKTGIEMTKKIVNALEILKSNRVMVGVSLLFGYSEAMYDDEKETIKFVGNMIKETKIHLVSLSLFNYHLCSIASDKYRQDMFDYGNVPPDIIMKQNQPPWSCFEEAGWFHEELRNVNEDYLWDILSAVDEYIEDKSVLVRRREFDESMELLNERKKQKRNQEIEKKPKKRKKSDKK
jgi:radical SAM superfamily enzyme YgiQ (UPF0313 family)